VDDIRLLLRIRVRTNTIAVAAARDITVNPRRAWRLTAVSNSC
jgi:hypothetical protein